VGKQERIGLRVAACVREPLLSLHEQHRLHELDPLKSIEAGEAAAKDQGVDFIRALIGVDRLQVQHMADDRELE
jgi:hypothetical protein